MRIRNIIIGVVVLSIFCISSFFIGAKYENDRDLAQHRIRFLNHFYNELDSEIQLLSRVELWGKSVNGTDVTINPYRQFLANLDLMRIMSDDAGMYMIKDKDSTFLHSLSDSFDLISRCIGGGASFNNQRLCNDFLKDGALSKAEIELLTTLRQDLQNIKNNLYSKETKQENPNLSMKNMSAIFKPFTDKYCIDNLPGIGFTN